MKRIYALYLLAFLFGACLNICTSEPILKEPPPEIQIAVFIPEMPELFWEESDIDMLAQMLWGEARGNPSDTEKAACVWCVLNRVDYSGSSIAAIVTAPNQFVGYSPDNPVDDSLRDLCEDVLYRWAKEKYGIYPSGRVLPEDYRYFTGYDGRNHFRNEYLSDETWDWSLPSPYES